MGDEEAYSLGVNPVRTRLVIIVMASFITAACVTVTGVIGWVGLVINQFPLTRNQLMN